MPSTNLYHAIQGFANEVGAVGSGTGTSRVAIFNRLVEHMSEASSPEQILGGMVAEMQPGQTVLDQAVSFWQEQTGSKTLPPVLNSRMVQDYDAVVHMNTRTGEMPPGSSIAVTSASREVSDKSKGYWKPLSRQDRTTLREWVEENRDNPDPAVQERVRAGIHKLGINP
jgi:coenzyme F420-reducing hydrogenase beta subunit